MRTKWKNIPTIILFHSILLKIKLASPGSRTRVQYHSEAKADVRDHSANMALHYYGFLPHFAPIYSLAIEGHGLTGEHHPIVFTRSFKILSYIAYMPNPMM